MVQDPTTSAEDAEIARQAVKMTFDRLKSLTPEDFEKMTIPELIEFTDRACKIERTVRCGTKLNRLIETWPSLSPAAKLRIMAILDACEPVSETELAENG